MANVTGRALRPFKWKGDQYKTGEVVKMPAHVAATYEKIDFIKISREEEKKVDAVVEKQVVAGAKANANVEKARETAKAKGKK